MLNQKFDYLYAENGRLKAVVVDNNGEPQVTDVTPDKPYSQSLITDGQGDTLVVSKKGQVMGVKEYKFAGDDRHLLNEYHRQLDSLGEWQINFTPAKNQTYAFDYLGSGDHGIFATDQYYPKSGSYDFRYKSVECGKNDKVIVDFGSYPQADSVVFKDKYGVKLKVVDGNILSFTGVSQPDTNYIYAYRGDKKIGKLFLNTYQQKTYKVVLVRVNKAAKKLDIDKVNEVLNKVYNQCAVKFEIATDTITIKDLHQFSHGGSGILTVYNDDQKKVLSAYEKEKKMTDGVFYLFFIDNVTDKKDGSGTPVSGYMPRGYNAGFIYDGGSPHTIAHELGHGIAGLEHVFENSNASGKTANLMDYASGEELWHFQWDQIQDPSRVWMKWNKDESEGEHKGPDELIVDILEKLRCFYASGKNENTFYVGSSNWTFEGPFDFEENEPFKVQIQLEKGHLSYCTVHKYTKTSNGYYVWYNFGDLTIKMEAHYQHRFERYLAKDHYFLSQTYKLTTALADNRLSDAIDLIYNYSDCVYEQLTAEQCTKLLKGLAAKTFLSENYEQIVLNLLRIVAENGSLKFQEEVLLAIFSIKAYRNISDRDVSIFESFYFGMNDFWGKKNYSEFMELLCKLYVNVKANELRKDANYVYEVVDSKVNLEGGQYHFTRMRDRFGNLVESISPLDIISVKGLDEKYDLLPHEEIVNVQGILLPRDFLKAFYKIHMPAFILAYVLNNINSEENTKTIIGCIRMLTLDGFLLPVEEAYKL